MANASWAALLNSPGAGANWTNVAGAALASSTTETIITPSSATIPDFTFLTHAPALTPGAVIRATAYGEYSTTGTPTLTLIWRYGGTGGVSLLTTGAVTTISGASHTSWKYEMLLTVRSTGTSGTAMCVGHTLGVAAAGTMALIPATTPAVATIDTTTAKSLTLTGTWGTPSASNTITCHQFFVEGWF